MQRKPWSARRHPKFPHARTPPTDPGCNLASIRTACQPVTRWHTEPFGPVGAPTHHHTCPLSGTTERGCPKDSDLRGRSPLPPAGWNGVGAYTRGELPTPTYFVFSAAVDGEGDAGRPQALFVTYPLPMMYHSRLGMRCWLCSILIVAAIACGIRAQTARRRTDEVQVQIRVGSLSLS